MSARFARISGGARNLAAIVAGALVLRLALLVERGDYIVYDEGYYLLLARSLRAGHGFTLNGLPHVSLSPLQPLLVAALSMIGMNDLWASRLIAAVAGAMLALPVAYLARQWFGERAATLAAVFVAVSPGLVTFLPFFPGERWNLYFGSEPLYLLLAMCALAAGWRAVREESFRWFAGLGALVALGYLARLEGAVLGAAVAVVVLVLLAMRRRLAALAPRLLGALVVAFAIVAPYLAFLHHTLGRWAVSGRVQAAAAAAAEPVDAGPPAPAAGGSGGRSSAVNAFVWGGDREALWRALYALDASGTRMASQYWGVAPRADGGGTPRPASSAPLRRAPSGDSGARPDSIASRAPAPRAPRGVWSTAGGAIAAIMPWWFLLLALPALAWARPRREAAAWLAAAALSAALPAALAYVEPRALLILVPAACILAGGATARLGELLAARAGRAAAWALVPAAVATLLLIPTARDSARSLYQLTPLQQVAAARRAVGEYLGAHLAPNARIVSWHPAIALYAKREWRVLPYESFGRIVDYARAQGAAIVVLSRFEPSPLRNPPRAFTAVLLDSASASPGEQVRLDLVEQTPTLFVGRLARSP